jgi:hypothetical protein
MRHVIWILISVSLLFGCDMSKTADDRSTPKDSGVDGGRQRDASVAVEMGDSGGKRTESDASGETEEDASPSCGRLAARAGQNQIQQLVRAYAFEKHPAMTSEVILNIEELEVPGLWEELRLQIFSVIFTGTDGQQFNESPFVYHDGKVEPFACAIGGYGVTSGVLLNGALYYTYSWGSGIHRSILAKMSWNAPDCTLTFIESAGFRDMDVFVYAKEGELWVDQGEYLQFNSWDKAQRFGSLIESEGSLAVLDEAGNALTPWGTPGSTKSCY